MVGPGISPSSVQTEEAWLLDRGLPVPQDDQNDDAEAENKP